MASFNAGKKRNTIRKDLFNGDVRYKSENFLNSHGLKVDDPFVLDKIKEIILEQRRNKECWLFSAQWEQDQIQESISRAEMAYDFVYQEITENYARVK